MADIVLSGLQPTSPENGKDISIHGQPTTAALIVNPTFSSLIRVSQNSPIYQNFNISNLDSPATGNRSARPGALQGRRPPRGQLFPRGSFLQNKL